MTSKLESEINYTFKNKSLLKKALTHKSSNNFENNEKLEFLGDRVLALVISKKVYLLYPNESEGDLDKRFAFLVNKKTCLKIGKNLELNKYLILGNTHKKKNEIEDKIIADACESLIGAIFIDKGFAFAEDFILKIWKKNIQKSNITILDHKTRLQEYSLKKYKKLPVYNFINSSGPRHKPTYKVSVSIHGSRQFYGTGKSIQQAEQDGAKNLLKKII